MERYSIMKWLGVWVVCCSMMSCAADREQLKRQSEAARNLGEVYMNQGDYTGALTEFVKAEKLNPNDSFLHNDLGLAYMAKEKLDLAIEHFKKAIELNPTYAPARNNLGTAYLAQKNWDAAIATLKEVTSDLLYATPHYPLANIGWGYFNKKEYAQAEKFYKDALKLEPEFVIALDGLGKTYIAMGKGKEAVDVLEKAVKIAPRFAEAYCDLGRAYASGQDVAKAMDAYKKCEALSIPDSERAQDAKKEIEKLKAASEK